MNPLETAFLNYVFRQQVRQGTDHPKRIRRLYQMIRDAAQEEFHEDNEATLDFFLEEQFRCTLKTR